MRETPVLVDRLALELKVKTDEFNRRGRGVFRRGRREDNYSAFLCEYLGVLCVKKTS
jgi:hypothetical protein